jgi:16S rRNA (cytidine1402-2'-O)-methyltransferase
LPARQSERRKAIRTLMNEPRTIVLYEAPHRLQETLEDALEILGNRPAVIAREVTKMYEEFLRGHLEDSLAAVRAKTPRGEITLLIGPPDSAARTEASPEDARRTMPIARRVDEIVKESGIDQKAALKQAARERGLTRREAYKQLLVTRDEWAATLFCATSLSIVKIVKTNLKKKQCCGRRRNQRFPEFPQLHVSDAPRSGVRRRSARRA